jgi:hypothetical protein
VEAPSGQWQLELYNDGSRRKGGELYRLIDKTSQRWWNNGGTGGGGLREPEWHPRMHTLAKIAILMARILFRILTNRLQRK